MPMKDQRVVISRRGDEPLVWDTEDGLTNFTMTPFGVMAEFEGSEKVHQLIPWMEITGLEVFNTSADREGSRSRVSVPVTCPVCKGRGLTTDGEQRCENCSGWGTI